MNEQDLERLRKAISLCARFARTSYQSTAALTFSRYFSVPMTECRALMSSIHRRAISRIDAFDRRCDAVSYPAHGFDLRRFNRCGTLTSVHRSGPGPRSRQANGIETMAPGRARGENAQTDVLVLLFRR
jgi:hypothetical protein